MSRQKHKLQKGIYILPSLFTTGNVFCGFYAFVAVLNEKYTMAAWALIFGIVFDILDGRVARMTKTTSAFGLQYDSLADVISFGMAPAFLAYSWVLKPFGRLGWMAAFLFLLCAALRLARFNVAKPDNSNGNSFTGLPTPAAAAIIASLVIASGDLFTTQLPPGVMVAVVYILAFLMVSNVKYPTFKRFYIKSRVPFTRFLFVVLAFYVFLTIPRIGVIMISFGYILMGPASWLISLRGKKHPEVTKTETQNPSKPQ